MRTKNYLWAVLAAATLSLNACVSGENEMTETQQKDAKLEIRLAGTSATTKATGDNLPTQNVENTIKRFTVAIFNKDQTVNTIQTVTASTTSPTTINCTPAQNCTGIVVANAPTENHFAGALNKGDFLKKVIALTDAQTSACLPMSGEVKDESGNATFTLVPGENTGMTAELKRLVARVSVSSIKSAFDPNGQYSAASYELKNIFVRDAVKEVVPAVGGYSDTQMTTPAFLTGSYAGTTGTAALATAVNPAVNVSTEHTADYWFYIFPNEDANKHTALVLEGTFKKNASDAGTTIYYPVIINKDQIGTSITGNSGTGHGSFI